MFDLEKAITEWRRRLAQGGVEHPDLQDELESHLREDIKQLMRSGLPEAEAFQSAVRKLGDGRALGKEFAAAAPTDGPARARAIALNVLGAWFILSGLNQLTGLLRTFFSFGLHFYWFQCLITAVLVLMGIGLLRRRNLWRRVALVWCILNCTGTLAAVLLFSSYPRSIYIYAPPSSPFVIFKFLGMTVPYGVFYAIGILHLIIFPLGVWLLWGKGSRRHFCKTAA